MAKEIKCNHEDSMTSTLVPNFFEGKLIDYNCSVCGLLVAHKDVTTID